MAQGITLHQILYIISFRRLCFQKFPSGRRIIEQIPHYKGSALRTPDLFPFFFGPPLNLIMSPGDLFPAAGDQLYLGHGSDAGQCLSPESKALDGKKILHGADFACGMGKKCGRHLILRDPCSVIRNPDKRNPTLLDLYGNGCRPGIHGILHELLYDSHGPFYYLTSSDLIDRRLI